MVRFARPLSEADTPVRPSWLDTVVAKFDAVDTMTLYDVAVADDPQFMVIEIGSLTVPLDGLARAGIAGAAMIVVKLQAPDQELAPPTFAAVTSQ